MASASNISVIIPLYNKASEIELTLRSVLIQSLPPREIIIVDDGSTDRSAEIVESIGSPLVRLIRQENSGVSAARNRAMREATGEWVALLDGDDMWGTDYLATVAEMIERWPGCGAYGTAFMIDDGNNCVPASCCEKMGVVDFFAESMTRYVLIPSATTLRRDLALELGGFPEGMRMGEDQFLWTKIARVADVCFMPKPSVIYSRAATNRSAVIYRPEHTEFSFEQLYEPERKDLSNEYIARVALGKALIESSRGGTEAARRALEFFSYNTMSHRIERKVRALNALPRFTRRWVLWIYNTLAWIIARKGL